MLAGGLSAYGASKSALEASTASWAKDLAGTGVTVNILVPGGPADTACLPPGAPKPPVLIDPQVMALPVVLACVCRDRTVSAAYRFVARDWDKKRSIPMRPQKRCARRRHGLHWRTSRNRRAAWRSETTIRTNMRGRKCNAGFCACAALLLAWYRAACSAGLSQPADHHHGHHPAGHQCRSHDAFLSAKRVKAKTGSAFRG